MSVLWAEAQRQPAGVRWTTNDITFDRGRGAAISSTDVWPPVRVRAPDLLACVPPETGHVDELGIRVEERGQGVRIAPIPRVHERGSQGLGPTAGTVSQGMNPRYLIDSGGPTSSMP